MVSRGGRELQPVVHASFVRGIVLDIPPNVLGWLAFASLVTFVVSAVALPWLMTRLPEDYFVETDRVDHPAWPRHRALYWAWRLLKNLLGAVLLLAGFVMLVTPGQGILTILAGLWLMDLPGKRRWERHLIGRPKVLASINWIRAKARKPPFRVSPERE